MQNYSESVHNSFHMLEIYNIKFWYYLVHRKEGKKEERRVERREKQVKYIVLLNRCWKSNGNLHLLTIRLFYKTLTQLIFKVLINIWIYAFIDK